MNALITMLALSVIPRAGEIPDDVDVIELNHFYDEHGKPVFSQFIFWDWDHKHATHVVRAWIMAETTKDAAGKIVVKGNVPVLRSRPKPTTDGWELVFADRAHWSVYRRVIGRSFRETWTQYDPELANRSIVDKDDRKPLSKPVSAIKKPANTR